MRSHAIAIAKAAGQILRDGLRNERQIQHKSASIDLVTNIDLASEKLIVSSIHEHFPEHRIVAEESGDDGRSAEYCWVIDPLDGTTNYAHGFPFFAVSIALLHNNQPTIGVVYDPWRDECFVGERGVGAWLNDQPLHVTSTNTVDAALLSTGFPYTIRTNPDNNIAEFTKIVLKAQAIRRGGAAALDICYVAAGRSEGHWELGLKPWDTAAAAVILTEAGGKLSTWIGAEWNPWIDRLVATNGAVHAELVALLQA
ncbi:inositol monophosphatase family protein [Herpetosiphon giganteus]|uniref:inositol monophosphatase family protein n=1 Tax=Herpetosiphon giganteus TaxID=2029754 RepID=UPI001956C75E|nr:inositol monophosphatase family protein [Herpetosiphon giganteus]MBM7846028.1 myo-inositol-1(or 4)-monophosphatase [Herpetosiphon giganteus]